MTVAVLACLLTYLTSEWTYRPHKKVFLVSVPTPFCLTVVWHVRTRSAGTMPDVSLSQSMPGCCPGSATLGGKGPARTTAAGRAVAEGAAPSYWRGREWGEAC